MLESYWHRAHWSAEWVSPYQASFRKRLRQGVSSPMHDVQGLPQWHPGICDLTFASYNGQSKTLSWWWKLFIGIYAWSRYYYHDNILPPGARQNSPSQGKKGLPPSQDSIPQKWEWTIAAPICWHYNKAATRKPFCCSSIVSHQETATTLWRLQRSPTLSILFTGNRSTPVHCYKSSSAAFIGSATFSWAKVETLPTTMHLNELLIEKT